MKQRILVVDDESQIRDMLSLYFSKHGYEVAVAGNSTDALRAAAEGKFEVAVLDIGLADEDGLKLLENLKSRYPELRVIMLTGMGFVEDLLEEAHRKGADGYVSKVLPLDELLLAIQRILKTTPA
ncbi:MAG TPA: response regulator [Candidatus Acidoferrum sp.]|nr:response regulator [Candidatus Acidoferrum sp.]